MIPAINDLTDIGRPDQRPPSAHRQQRHEVGIGAERLGSLCSPEWLLSRQRQHVGATCVAKLQQFDDARVTAGRKTK